MTPLRKAGKPLLCALLGCAFAGNAMAEEAAIDAQRPATTIFVRPYRAPVAPPIRLKDSHRLSDLIRAGKLYLTVQDAIALAIENNLDLEVDRYGPIVQQWQVERAEAGGVLRGVTSGNSQIGQVASGQGVVGSERSAGLVVNNGGNNGNSAGATVSQIGPVTANLDPVLYNTSLWSHTTSPQSNAVASQTTSLVDISHIYNTSVQQGLLSGGYLQSFFNESYLKENAPTDILNPSVAPRWQVYIQHNLLQGLGTKVNGRFIRVAKKNAIASESTFRSQLLNVIARVLNLYWDLVTDHDDLKFRQSALDLARTSFEDTKKEIQIGALSRVDIYLAQSEFANRQRELSLAQTAVRQQENLLKSALSRTGLEDPAVDGAEVVTLDSIQVPASDNLPPLRDLVSRALKSRPDLAVSRINEETAEITAIGTENALLPSLVGFAGTYNSGLAGRANPTSGILPDPAFVGGFPKAVGQVLRRDFPNNRAGAYLSIPLNNRQAQADYGVDQLQLYQTKLSTRRDLNQLVVDIASQAVALRQARARYSTAVETRTLQQQLLEKEKQNFALGGSTLIDVINAERSLFAAQSAEVAALAAYSHASVALDQVLGETLEVNHVSVEDALRGQAKLSN